MVLANSQHDGESRFAHLLQPIRDLATNWDIDLARELEDYLSEVRLFAFMYVLCLTNIAKC